MPRPATPSISIYGTTILTPPDVAAKGLADQPELVARKEAWAEAYWRTPHGKPVELAFGRRRE